MALYEYSLYLTRQANGKSLVADLRHHGLIQEVEHSREVLSISGARAFLREEELILAPGRSESVVSLLVADADIDMLTANFETFTDWIWRAARSTSVSTIFMPGGSDVDGGWKGSRAELSDFLASLIVQGRLTVAHAVMFFADFLGDGELCRVDHEAYSTDVLPGVGCLYMLVDGRAGRFEILEPGGLQSPLLHPWSIRPNQGEH